MGKYRSGRFKPLNPEKYKGNVHDIVYRSSYELRMLSTLDSDPNVIQYSSEEVIIRYKSPIDGKVHRYFMDFWVKRKSGDGFVEQLIEVKPKQQTLAPVSSPNKKGKTYLREVTTYLVNQAKWQAAEDYAKARGMEFIVYTEQHLNIVKFGKQR